MQWRPPQADALADKLIKAGLSQFEPDPAEALRAVKARPGPASGCAASASALRLPAAQFRLRPCQLFSRENLTNTRSLRTFASPPRTHAHDPSKTLATSSPKGCFAPHVGRSGCLFPLLKADMAEDHPGDPFARS